MALATLMALMAPIVLNGIGPLMALMALTALMTLMALMVLMAPIVLNGIGATDGTDSTEWH
jgi:hypothetical protein